MFDIVFNLVNMFYKELGKFLQNICDQKWGEKIFAYRAPQTKEKHIPLIKVSFVQTGIHSKTHTHNIKNGITNHNSLTIAHSAAKHINSKEKN